MKRSFLILFAIIALLLIAVIYFFPHFARYLHADAVVQNIIEQQLGRPISFDSLHIKIIPSLSLQLKNFSIREKEYFREKDLINIKSLEVKFHLASLFLKRFTIKKLTVRQVTLTIQKRGNKHNVHEFILDQARHRAQQSKNTRDTLGNDQKSKPAVTQGTAHTDFIISKLKIQDLTIFYKKFDAEENLVFEEAIRDVSGVFKNVTFAKPITFTLKGILSRGEQYILTQGTVTISRQDVFKGSEFQATVATKDFKLYDVFNTYFSFLPSRIEAGTMSADLTVRKVKGDKNLQVSGVVEVKDCHLLLKEFPQYNKDINATFDVDFLFPFPLQSLHVNKFRATFASTHVQLEGNVDFIDRLITMRCYSSECNILDVPFLGDLFLNNIPPEYTIDGKTTFDAIIKGDFFKQNLKGNFDFTNNKFIFNPYFMKPLHSPLSVEINFDIEASRSLNGAFTLLMEDLTLKGDIPDFDFASQEGECTFLTNKFALDPFNDYLPVMEGLAVGGRAKIVCNAQGVLTKSDSMEFNIGVTLDDVLLKRNETLIVEGLDSSITFDEHKIEMNETAFMLFDSSFKGWGSVENYKMKPNVSFDIYSSSFNLDTVLQYFTLEGKEGRNQEKDKQNQAAHVPIVLEKNAQHTDAETVSDNTWVTRVQNYMAEGAFYFDKVLYKDTFFETVKGVVQLHDGSLRMENFECKGLDGTLAYQSTFDMTQKPFTYQNRVHVKDVNLEQLFIFIQGADYQNIIDGHLSCDVNVNGQGFRLEEIEKSLQGGGSVLIRDGELKQIDIFKALSKTKNLLGLKEHAYGGTKFSDIEAPFRIETGKIITDEVQLTSDDFRIKAAGSLSFRGNLDYILEVFLSPQLSRTFIPGVSEVEVISIPLSITGHVMKPRYSVTGGVVKKIVSGLLQKGLDSILKREKIVSNEDARPVSKRTAITDDDITATDESRPIGAIEAESDQTIRDESDEALIGDALRMGLDLLFDKTRE
ncbi:MAG: AsmA family protein [Candidatus Omnitrophica bacterium]|nr:AsmA family protein [Candidatus Omnitrophota bacterium]